MSASVPSPVLLETRKLLKQFGEFRAVDHVDFRVQEGEVLALIGSNGAGKTTLVNLISGLLRADAGTIVFRGQDVTDQTVHERIAAGIARSFQLVNLFDQLSALDNVALAIFSRQGKTRKLFSLADAERAGLFRAGPFSPGLGTHLIDPRSFVQGAGRARMTDDQITHPLAWIYDGTEPTAPPMAPLTRSPRRLQKRR